MRNKKGSLAKKNNPWMMAVKKARAALKIKGFCAVKKGTPLYLKAKELFKCAESPTCHKRMMP